MIMNIRFNCYNGLAAMMCLMLGAVSQAAETTTTFDGVWKVVKPVTQLKTTAGKTPPLLPAAMKLYAQRTAKLQAGDRSFDSTLWCKPMGEPRTAYDAEGGVFEIRTNAKVVLFSYTWNRMVRWVSINDQAVDVIGPTYYGTANAHWEGKTLVVDTEGLHEETLLDASGMPHSDALKMTQRYSLKADGQVLEETIRFEDANTFSQPWQAVVTYQRQPAGTAIPEDVCLERRGINNY